MNIRNFYILLFVAFCVSRVVGATPPIGVAYWDVDGFYDTIPSLFYDDTRYTSSGRYRWTTERYRAKVERVVEVVDSMRLPLVALYGVESEDVVRDIVATSKIGYSYTHRTISSRDGLDFALLYFGDILAVDYVRVISRRLYVEGVLSVEEPRSGGKIHKCRIGIWLAMSSEDMCSCEPPHNLPLPDIMLVAGRVSHRTISRLKIWDPLNEQEREGRGNCASSRGWYLRDRIGVKPAGVLCGRGIYIKSWLLDPRSGVPLGTFNRDSYTAGYSRSLPIYLYLDVETVR
ncbi:MAG: hypothetical protein SNH01_07340 [Rikenellaceae bacterium]